MRTIEQVAKCRALNAVYKSGKLILDGPHISEIDIGEEHHIHIRIEQLGIRKIEIKSDVNMVVYDLYAMFTRVERLLMLFDGTFLSLAEIQLSESDVVNENVLNTYKEHLIQGRLSYFLSADFCSYSVDKLIEFDAVLTKELFFKWEQLLEELDVVHQMYLYSLSDSRITVDVKCAFLIELAEPLVEIVKSRTNYFSELTPGERGTTLKKCLDALVKKYGTEIFAKELSNNYEQFLSTMVNSRVRIMHIKREQNGLHFNGNESILYALKMSLLYRRILFEVLNIDEIHYKEKLLKSVSRIDKWNDVLNCFLLKIST